MREDPGTTSCPREDIAAYIDGELTGGDQAAFELHLKACDECSRTLREQRQFLAALSASLGRADDIDLPADFPRTVTSYAESSVSAVRGTRELARAAAICLGLIGIALAALLWQPEACSGPATLVLGKVLAFGTFVLRSVVHVAFALVVVLRGLASRTGVETLLVLILAFAALAVSGLTLLRISRKRSMEETTH